MLIVTGPRRPFRTFGPRSSRDAGEDGWQVVGEAQEHRPDPSIHQACSSASTRRATSACVIAVGR
jgi:hypothetical protein